MRNLVLIALLAAVTPSVSAQRAGFGVSHHRPAHSPAIFFADSFYSDALYRKGYPVTSQTPVVILQAAPTVTLPPSSPIQPPAQPLMIELQDGRYVRLTGEETSTAEIRTIDPDTKAQAMDRQPSSRWSAKSASSETRTAPPLELTPAILVFRDGHHEEVSDYTIADGILYTRSNFYTDGSWTHKIALSSLNLPDTITTNQSRNVKFQLPTAPNEVIVRP